MYVMQLAVFDEHIDYLFTTLYLACLWIQIYI